ncbi:hypothetical protein JG687_00018191, partial [Phytophthora cactorum]
LQIIWATKRTPFTFEDDKDLVQLARSYVDGRRRISWADIATKCSAPAIPPVHSSSDCVRRCKPGATMSRAFLVASSRKFAGCVAVLLPSLGSCVCLLLLRSPEEAREALLHLQRPPSPSCAPADRLAIAGALATAQAAKVMRSVGLDADEIEQVGVVDVAKVKQSAVGDADEL